MRPNREEITWSTEPAQKSEYAEGADDSPPAASHGLDNRGQNQKN